MISLTVKTLDAQNHNFEVDDDITVEQFKAKIADTVNIPAETQRIIYCGRVLQDNSKLSDYDVNGKVVHLVQRAPPGANNRNANRAGSPQPQRNRTFQLHGLESGNAMYLGSMAFPPNLIESQGIVPPPPTHTLAGSRLNVAKRMLKRAEAAIRVLENPQARATDLPAEEPQEEVTPVIEARVIVPSNNSEPIDEAMVLSAVHDTLLNATGRTREGEGSTSVAGESNTAETSRTQSASSTPEGNTPTRSSTENLATDQASEPSGSGQETNDASNSLPENASRSTEMAELLTMLANLQLRFAPFLERYHTFMQQDPVVAAEDVPQTQAMLTRVSGVLHCLGHAYHSLSDIIIRVRTPPPRPLLCRPIIIQHSAVVQAGIPIQVEAQINLSPDRPNENAQQQQRGDGVAANGETNGSAPSSTSETSNSQPAPSASLHINNTPLISAQIQPMMGIPFLPGASMRVQSFPIEVHGVRHPLIPHNVNAAQSQNNNNNTTASNSVSSSETASAASSTTTSSNVTNETSSNIPGSTDNSTNNTANNANVFNLFNMQDNPNVELFMEVTPFATLDSMESTLVGPNQQSEAVFRGALNGPPQNFLQSLIQMAGGMAGQVINRAAAAQQQQQMNGQSSAQPSAPPATSNTSTPASTTAETENPQANGSSSASQATANTNTTTTTSTHTRSTSRPHVHLAHQAMQGGFDPFLPCNSHHLPPRRRVRSHATAQAGAGNNNNTTRRENVSAASTNGASRPSGAQNRVNMPMTEQINAIINHMIMRMGGQVAGAGVIPGATANINLTRSSSAPPPATTNASNTNNVNPTASAEIPPFPFVAYPGFQNILQQNLRQSPSLIELIQSLPPPGNYNPGESLITDLLMMLAEHMTLGDVYTINTGNLEPLIRIRNEISNFFLTHIVNNSTSPESIDAGVEKIITEIRPFLEQFSVLQVRDNIDMPRSVEALFRNRLPNIVRLASTLNVSSTNGNSMRLLVDQCLTTLRHLCALALFASVNGQNGVNQVADQFITRYIQGIPQSLRQWTLLSTRMQLMQFMSNLSVPESILQPYIVREPTPRSPSPPVPELIQQQIVDTSQNLAPEAMEFEEASASNSDLSSPPILEDNEIVPNYILGSESWHRQVPAHWVPIIARDAQRQRRQSTQPPFSDAYLSGMPSKRRKIVNSNKPQGSLPQVISDSVRRAVTATGLTQVAPLETVAQAAGSSTDIQSAYRSLLRTSVQSNLTNNEDFTPERYPNASTYFNNPQ